MGTAVTEWGQVNFGGARGWAKRGWRWVKFLKPIMGVEVTKEAIAKPILGHMFCYFKEN